MYTCDVCEKQLGILGKFKYSGGYICKECYKKASRNFTETITQKSLAEIRELCLRKQDEESMSNFIITGKIGSYLLIDEKNGRICIPNNRAANQKITDPEFYDIAEIQHCEIQSAAQNDGSLIQFLRVCMTMKDGNEIIIRLISNPVRKKSYAFRQSFHFAQRIQAEMNRLIQSERKEYDT